MKPLSITKNITVNLGFLLIQVVTGSKLVLILGIHFASAYSFLCILVVWVMVHRFSYWGPQADHGEIIVLMLGAFAGRVASGPGVYSFDYLIADRKSN